MQLKSAHAEPTAKHDASVTQGRMGSSSVLASKQTPFSPHGFPGHPHDEE
jgi:hypothetical protein